ncbi:MAG: glycosyltransferase family 4 protein [Rhodospirillales bacterium]|nr:glycosyltransferase family 4 protein [Rhodospirillales bacterium]
MRVLFVHQNFPGQYLHLAPALAARGDEVVALAIEGEKPLPGVRTFRYKPQRRSSSSIHPWVADIETKVIRGEAAAQAALALHAKGFRPDVICAHPGWGEALFLKDVFPEAPLLSFIEFFYRSDGADFGFDPGFAEDLLPGRCRLRMKNANSLLNLDAADWCVSPTEWQASTVPERYRDRFSIVHDGIDTDRVKPEPRAVVKLAKAGLTLRPGDEVITFVNRNMEPYRGFHIFMRALPEIQRRRPNAITLIVGGDEVSYGRRLAEGETWRQKMLAEVGERLDMDRVRFVGRIPYPEFVAMLQVSAVHVYLTYPFVLSWSMLEAMSAGCVVVGSATPPVQEVIRDGDNGLLVDFFSTEAIAAAIDRVLSHPDRMAELRARARRTAIERYDLRSVCLPRHVALVDAVASGGLPPRFDAETAAARLRPPAPETALAESRAAT